MLHKAPALQVSTPAHSWQTLVVVVSRKKNSEPFLSKRVTHHQSQSALLVNAVYK